MKIKIIATGGTIDAKYNIFTSAVDYGSTHIEKMLEQGRSRVDIEIKELMQVDSQDIDDAARQLILSECQNVDTDRIVVTHGTNTLVETAKFLGRAVDDKTIIILGSMMPYALGNSDALFNLGMAIAAVQTLDRGVFVTMNGKVFTWDNVVKDFEKAEFIEKSA